MVITFEQAMSGKVQTIDKPGPQTIANLFGRLATLLCKFFCPHSDRELGAHEEIPSGATVKYLFMQVSIDIWCHDKYKGTIQKLSYIEAVCNPLAAKGIADLEDVRKLEQKKNWYKLKELCDQIVLCLEEALKKDQEAPYARWIIDGIHELMKKPLVRKRNALHEMEERGHLRIIFVDDHLSKCGIRLKTANFMDLF